MSLLLLPLVVVSAPAARADAAHVSDEWDLFNRINIDRANHGVPALRMSLSLHQRAQYWAGVYNGSNGSSSACAAGAWSDDPNVGPAHPGTAGNAGCGGAGMSPATMEANYEASPEHQANNLHPALKCVGVGWSVAPDGTVWNAVDFNTGCSDPENPPPPPAPPASFPTPVQSMVVRPNGEIDIAAVTPDRSLLYYYKLSSPDVWHVNVVAGPGTAWSAPSLVVRPNGVEADIAVQGPGNTLLYWYNFAGSPQGWIPAHVPGQNVAFSAPSLVVRGNGVEADIAVQGPGHTLAYWYNFSGSPQGWLPGNISGQAFSAPSLFVRSTGEADIAVQGPGHTLAYWYNFSGGGWNKQQDVGGNGAAVAYSDPSLFVRSTGEADIAVQGPGYALQYWYNPQGGSWYNQGEIGGPGAALARSAPSLVVRSNGEANIAVQGPSYALLYFYNFPGGGWNRPIPDPAPSNGAYSAPSLFVRSNGEADVAVQGPNQSLAYFYNQSSQPWYQAPPPGGNGSTL